VQSARGLLPAVTRWTVLESQVLIDRRWLRLHRERLRLPSGQVIEEFHLFESPNWSAVIAIRPDGEVVLVDQYRRGLDRVSRELPAGVIDPGESPLQAAKRELAEETGYQAPHWLPLVELSPEPHRSTHRAHFFVAWGAEALCAARPESTECIEVVTARVGDLLGAVDRGGIDHAAHVAAILMASARGWLCPEPPLEAR
jgi:8-oxo-dGTP pyrophosphatase MutT (NUDIX family)